MSYNFCNLAFRILLSIAIINNMADNFMSTNCSHGLFLWNKYIIVYFTIIWNNKTIVIIFLVSSNQICNLMFNNSQDFAFTTSAATLFFCDYNLNLIHMKSITRIRFFNKNIILHAFHGNKPKSLSGCLIGSN